MPYFSKSFFSKRNVLIVVINWLTMTSIPNFSVAVCEIISKLGKVMSIEVTEAEDAIEIWIVPEGEESAFAFYLFPYDAGVVYYG